MNPDRARKHRLQMLRHLEPVLSMAAEPAGFAERFCCFKTPQALKREYHSQQQNVRRQPHILLS